ncbi:MAG TPA: VWA domain-containing protein, partial [Candidatus Acidoferrales bacterium]|nr:VWA domain-containing protein [Candidatus Acidoferrales bacterium]
MAVALAFVLAPIFVWAQSASDIPKIRVATRLVEIGVIVHDKNGPVENLTKDDFVVLERGKPQKIGLFSVESARSAAQPAIQAAQPLPQNTFSDLPRFSASTPRSVTIVLLDNLNTLYGSAPESKYEATPYWLEDLALENARAHLVEFIKNLNPQDRVAIYGLSHSLHVVCDFTSDRDQLLAILKKYDTKSMTNRGIVEPGRTSEDFGGHMHHTIFGQGSGFENGVSSRLAGAANEDRAEETMVALQAIAAHVANIPGRKNLVWLTADLPFSGAAMAHVLGPANIAAYPVDARGLLARSVSTELLSGTADADEVSGAAGHLD